MKVLGVVGPASAGRRSLVERLAERLGRQGRVATVHRLPSGDGAGPVEGEPTGLDRPPGATVAYGVGEGGEWAAGGESLTLSDTLDRLAPDNDYAILAGFPDADVPTVVLGGDRGGDGDGDERGANGRGAPDPTGPTLAAAPDAGAVDVDGLVEALREVEPHETLESLVARAKRSPAAERAGAIATFTGRVRARDGPDDDPTEYLEFEKYEGVAEERMDALSAELTDREGVFEVLMHHRTGVVEYGEDIVFVVVLAGHREEAFRTVEDGIDRLKEEVPIFKREVTVEEEFWVHERE